MKELDVSYNVWKSVVQANSSWEYYHFVDGYQSLCLWTGTSDYVYHTDVYADDYGDWVNNFYGSSGLVVKRDDAIANILNLTSPISSFDIHTSTSDEGLPIVAFEKPIIQKHNVYSHNLCDPTTWYTNAVRVVDEVAENAGDNQTYQLDNYNVIDTYHGKLVQEDYLTDSSGYSYRVSVKVNDVDGYSEQDPHYGTDGDFTIDYGNGQINFLASLDPSDEVKVTYHYATDSVFIIAPESGKKTKLFNVEVQFTTDVVIDDTVMHQVYVYNPYYPIGPLKVPYGDPVKYKSVVNMQTEANKAYPTYPMISSSTWRGVSQEMCILSWDYLGGESLLSSVGAEIRISLEHDNPLSGTFATMTFYGTQENE